MDTSKIKRLKYACYTTNLTMSVVGNLAPMLFLTFREIYGISYSLLGTLVLINFVTQLTVDLIFSFFSHRFNIEKAVKLTPWLGVIGLALFGLLPYAFPNNIYLCLVIGTLIFSSASGFAEVLISPVIAALPSDNPDREMSKLHSVYAWGVVGVIITGTIYLYIFGKENWQILPLAFALVPLASALLFSGSEIPKMKAPEKASGVLKLLRRPALWLCVFAIFLGGASELIMAQWCSSYIEGALGIPKVWGDIFGTALFGLTLGLGRTLYAKKGKNLGSVLLFGAIGATTCYIIASVSGIPILGLIACGMTGFFVSMMWPGSLVVAEEKIPDGGVFVFAMMAAGGDLGASVGPQAVGLITDGVMASSFWIEIAQNIGISVEQLGMKLGMLSGTIFPLAAIIIFGIVNKSLKNKKR